MPASVCRTARRNGSQGVWVARRGVYLPPANQWSCFFFIEKTESMTKICKDVENFFFLNVLNQKVSVIKCLVAPYSSSCRVNHVWGSETFHMVASAWRIARCNESQGIQFEQPPCRDCRMQTKLRGLNCVASMQDLGQNRTRDVRSQPVWLWVRAKRSCCECCPSACRRPCCFSDSLCMTSYIRHHMDFILAYDVTYRSIIIEQDEIHMMSYVSSHTKWHHAAIRLHDMRWSHMMS